MDNSSIIEKTLINLFIVFISFVIFGLVSSLVIASLKFHALLGLFLISIIISSCIVFNDATNKRYQIIFELWLLYIELIILIWASISVANTTVPLTGILFGLFLFPVLVLVDNHYGIVFHFDDNKNQKRYKPKINTKVKVKKRYTLDLKSKRKVKAVKNLNLREKRYDATSYNKRKVPSKHRPVSTGSLRCDTHTKVKEQRKGRQIIEINNFKGTGRIDTTKAINSKHVTTADYKINNTKESNVVQKFLKFILDHHQLSIANYFDQVNTYESFFLVAATGLGKTVALPIYLLQKRMEAGVKKPTIWVVVPKIPIAKNEAIHLNETFDKFKKSDSNLVISKKLRHLFGYRTSTGSKHTKAPIQFITTGVLPLIANSGELDQHKDIVVIDEAHVTLETDEAIELAIESLWKQGITVNYMSATVDTNNLSVRLQTKIIQADKTRFTNYYHNTGDTLLNSIEDIIENTLGNFNLASRYYPTRELWGNNYNQLINGVNPQGRSTGMLVVIGSFASDKDSDRAKLQRKIHSICNRFSIQIITYAGEIERNSRRKAEFEAKLQEIYEKNQRYIIIATDIIEMGVTIETLDYVVTMDSHMIDQMVGGFKFPQTVPLGTNSLKQRGGRVGRKRPGCVYITKEFGTDYTDLNDRDLNFGGLDPQPIRFPLEYCEPYKLAFSLCSSGITSHQQVKEYLVNSGLPSLYKNPRIGYIASMTTELIQKYKALGVDDPANKLALAMSQRWVGDNMFPFVFEGFKYLVENGYDGLKIFTLMIYYGSLLDYPVSKLLLETTVDHYDSNGRAIVRDGLIRDGDNSKVNYKLTNNSDMIRMAAEMSYSSFGIAFDQELLEVYKPGGYSWNQDQIANICEAGFNHVNFNKMNVALISNFIEILKQIQKQGFEDEMKRIGRELPDMTTFIEKGYNEFDYSGDFNLDRYAKDVACIKPKMIDFDPIYFNQDLKVHETIYNIFLRIYKLIGFSFTVTPTNQKGIYQYGGIKDGKKMFGFIDQGEHYCQLNTVSTFYGILKPRIDKKTGETVIDLVHILRVGNDYHGN